MLVTEQALDLLRVAASRQMRARWYVVERDTGRIISTAVFARPYPVTPGLIVVSATAPGVER